MDEPLRKLKIDGGDLKQNNEESFDLNDLLHPAQAFSHPGDVVNDPDLTLNEKRAILARWASDACAIESVPALRRAPTRAGPGFFGHHIVHWNREGMALMKDSFLELSAAFVGPVGSEGGAARPRFP